MTLVLDRAPQSPRLNALDSVDQRLAGVLAHYQAWHTGTTPATVNVTPIQCRDLMDRLLDERLKLMRDAA